VPIGNPFFRSVGEGVISINTITYRSFGESKVGQAAIKVVNDIALVVSLVRSSEAPVMMKHYSVGYDPDHRLKVFSWSWNEIKLRGYDNSWVLVAFSTSL
jgi:hypothetical protein